MNINLKITHTNLHENKLLAEHEFHIIIQQSREVFPKPSQDSQNSLMKVKEK